jgi:hypothetical protein
MKTKNRISLKFGFYHFEKSEFRMPTTLRAIIRKNAKEEALNNLE